MKKFYLHFAESKKTILSNYSEFLYFIQNEANKIINEIYNGTRDKNKYYMYAYTYNNEYGTNAIILDKSYSPENYKQITKMMQLDYGNSINFYTIYGDKL